MVVGDLIKYYRERDSMSRTELASLSRCSMEHVRRIERSLSRPSPDLLIRMAKALDLGKDEVARLRVCLARENIPEALRPYVVVSRK